MDNLLGAYYSYQRGNEFNLHFYQGSLVVSHRPVAYHEHKLQPCVGPLHVTIPKQLQHHQSHHSIQRKTTLLLLLSECIVMFLALVIV